MKNKKIIIITFIALVSIIIVIGVLSIKYVKNKKKNEYVPQEEISEEQDRQTIVKLYFLDKETNTLKTEVRMVNIKDLTKTPYEILLKLLIEGPKNEKLEKILPEDTKILNVSIEKDCLSIDFSDEILNYDKKNDKGKENLIYSIVNTLTELKEVNRIKIIINGEKNQEFAEEYIRK